MVKTFKVNETSTQNILPHLSYTRIYLWIIFRSNQTVFLPTASCYALKLWSSIRCWLTPTKFIFKLKNILAGQRWGLIKIFITLLVPAKRRFQLLVHNFLSTYQEKLLKPPKIYRNKKEVTVTRWARVCWFATKFMLLVKGR